ncbi:MAG: ice-binding family protein [Dehalococcoidia bacterium]|nr:ice-binding family protein [Dehalococcoidia bacterium]
MLSKRTKWAKYAALAACLSLIVLLGAACGKATPTPTATARPAATSTATAVPAATSTTAPTAQTGTVEVRVTDAPPEGVSKVLITASKIEAQRSGNAGEAGWSTIVETPPVFDLVAVTGLEAVLGSSALPEGSYTQVRLSITKIVVTVQGQDKVATVPSDKLRVVGNFQVAANLTTVLTLDFDADKSVVLAGDKVQFLPVVKLLTRAPSDKPEPLKKLPTATPVPAATSTATAVPAATSTATAVPAATSTATAVPTATSTATAVPTATSTATAVPAATPTATAVPAATPTATTVPAPTPTPTTAPLAGRAPINLGTAGDFAILAKTGVSTTGTTSIVGDIGVSPAAATYITGFGLIMDSSNTFSTSSLVTGKVYAADYTPPTPAKMTAAVSDMETAYTDAAGRTLPDTTELGAGDISGMTLAPGLHKWGTGVLITSGVTLNCQGNANAVFIFQIAQNLTVANGAIVTLSGGCQAKNIFWQVAGETTLGTTAAFKGIILSQTLVSMNTGATLDGRALAQTAVTLDANAVTKPN